MHTLPRWLDRTADAAMSVARNAILSRGVVVSACAEARREAQGLTETNVRTILPQWS